MKRLERSATEAPTAGKPESGEKRRRLLERHQAVPGHRSPFHTVDLIAQVESMQWYAE
jgi:hypothetical protein